MAATTPDFSKGLGFQQFLCWIANGRSAKKRYRCSFQLLCLAHSLPALSLRKYSIDVPMPFDEVRHFEEIAIIPEENHVFPESETSNIRPKFGTRTTDRRGQFRQITTFLTQRSHKTLGHYQATARASDVFEDSDQVCLCRRQHAQLWHS
jgi:hypothetical protein